MSDCVFCGILTGAIPCAKVAEDDSTFAFMDIDPGADGQVLVIPKNHCTDLFDIPADDLIATTLMAQRVAKASLPALGAQGVNLFNCSRQAAWQTVFHFHLHVIPRYDDAAREKMELLYEPGQPADVEAIGNFAKRLAAAF